MKTFSLFGWKLFFFRQGSSLFCPQPVRNGVGVFMCKHEPVVFSSKYCVQHNLPVLSGLGVYTLAGGFQIVGGVLVPTICKYTGL